MPAFPWFESLLLVSTAMAGASSLKFFFPGLAGVPLGWNILEWRSGLHKPWEPFPAPEVVLAQDKSREIYEGLVESFFQRSGVGVLFFGGDLRLRGMNAQARLSLSAPLGALVSEVVSVPAATAVEEAWRDGCDSRFDQGQVALLRDKDGECYGVALFLLPAGDNPSREDAPGLLEDITLTKQLASVGMHSAGMAHEIKNPLVALKTFAELLPSRFDDPEFRIEFSRLALNQIRRIEGIVNDLLDYAKPKKPALLPGDPMAILQEAMEILSMQMREGNITVVESCTNEALSVLMDAEQMRRVFLNVLLNALEAMPKGGELKLSCARQTARDGTQNIAISVSDSGPGIPERDLQRIFEPFFSTKKKGSGLGLAISKRIVEDHGGLIRFTGATQGTRCIIELPIWKEDFAAWQGMTGPGYGRGNGKWKIKQTAS